MQPWNKRHFGNIEPSQRSASASGLWFPSKNRFADLSTAPGGGEPDGGGGDPGGGGGPFDSAFLHWDVSDSASVSLTGSEIQQVDDQTGNGRHLARVTGDSPQLLSSAQNGLDAADCSAGADNLEHVFSSALDQPFTWHVVLNRQGAAYLVGAGGSVPERLVYRNTSGKQVSDFGSALITSSGFPASSWLLVTVVVQGASSKIWLNDSLEASGNVGAGDLSKVNFRRCYWGECVCFDSALDDTSVGENISTLMTKWGL